MKFNPVELVRHIGCTCSTAAFLLNPTLKVAERERDVVEDRWLIMIAGLPRRQRRCLLLGHLVLNQLHTLTKQFERLHTGQDLQLRGAVAQAFRMHVHCQFHFRATERSDITMESIRERVRQVIGSKGTGTIKKVPKPRNSAASRRSRNPTAVSKTTNVQSPSSNLSTGKVKAMVNKTLRPPVTPQRKRYMTSRSPTRVVRAPTAIPASSSSSSSSSRAPPVWGVPAVKTEVKPSVSPLAQPKSAGPVVALSEPKIHLPGPFMTLDTKGDLLEENMKDAPVALREAVEKVKKGGDEADFVVVGWRHGAAAEGGKGEQLELKETGKGGVQALTECLQAHSVLYGLVRVTENVGNTEKEKLCCVRWAPEAVPVTVTRSEIGSFQGEVSKLFQPYHGDLTASDPSQVTPEAVAARVRKFRLKQ